LRIGAPADVRLACQLRPSGNVSVVPIVRTARPVYRAAAPRRSTEHNVVVLYCDFRNRADLTGNKRVCDRGACGACTMIVDGRTVYSCSTLAIEVQGKQIRTVDGLANGNTLHPVQQAFVDQDGLMCGFCTPGFVMATVALLERTPNPTVEQARKGLDGNICRCGTFVRIMEAALKAKGVARA